MIRMMTMLILIILHIMAIIMMIIFTITRIMISIVMMVYDSGSKMYDCSHTAGMMYVFFFASPDSPVSKHL
jgi:hypothetical protein